MHDTARSGWYGRSVAQVCNLCKSLCAIHFGSKKRLSTTVLPATQVQGRTGSKSYPIPIAGHLIEDRGIT
jgi:hypothetical protein